MLEKAADRFSRYLVSIDSAKEEDREIVAYGIFRALSTAMQLVIMLLTSLLIGNTPEAMTFTVMFGLLKRYAGGAHASRQWTCLTVFTAGAHAVWFLCRIAMSVIAASYLTVGVTLAALILVLIRAPVPHPDNPKSPSKLKQLRKKAMIVALSQSVIVSAGVLFLPESADLLILCGAMGGFCAAFTLILPMPATEGR